MADAAGKSVEIERKFLVLEGRWTARGQGTPFAQRYLSDDPDRTVRVRVAGDSAWLTVKGRASDLVRVHGGTEGRLSADPDRTVTVRAGDGAGRLSVERRRPGLAPLRIEVGVPPGDALLMLALCLPDGTNASAGPGGPASPPGLTRAEVECGIPADVARELMALCLPGGVEKVRHRLPAGDVTWEVDVFGGANAGLVVAEVELPDESHPFPRPDWLGPEVSHDARYLNSNLAVRPWGTWREPA